MGFNGQATEKAIMWILKEFQAGRIVTADDSWNHVARPFLSNKWNESIEGKWKNKPKQFCCLREHYYKQIEDDNLAKRQIADQVKLCIENFIKIFYLGLIKSKVVKRLELQHLICRVTQNTSFTKVLRFILYQTMSIGLKIRYIFMTGKQVK